MLCAGGGQPLVEPDGLVSVGAPRGEQRDGQIDVGGAGSRFPDLRTAGTAYVDLAVALLTARGTDGYQTVWFYQRLSAACAKHGR